MTTVEKLPMVVPDLVVEVVSPGSAVHDRHDKNVAYAQAGVPEYWIVDPFSHTVELLTLKDEKYRVTGVFQGKAVLPSMVLPGFNVAVEKFFASVWL
jgi:Uma2 family endonuclease